MAVVLSLRVSLLSPFLFVTDLNWLAFANSLRGLAFC
jgi:hypothetical protein